MANPFKFSDAQIEAYVKCLESAKIGDKIIYYIDHNSYVTTEINTRTATALVIGKVPKTEAKLYYYGDKIKYIDTLILGSNKPSHGFDEQSRWVYYIKKYIQAYNDSVPNDQKMIWFRPVGFHMRIKEIIKRK